MAAASERKHTANAQRGALVLEALTAVAVFSFGVLGTLALHAQAMRAIDDARYRTEAVNLAQTLIATMWASDAATLASRYSGAGGEGYAAFARLARRLPGTELPGNAPIVSVDAGPSAASRRVKVTLRWQMPAESVARRYDAIAIIGGD